MHCVIFTNIWHSVFLCNILFSSTSLLLFSVETGTPPSPWNYLFFLLPLEVGFETQKIKFNFPRSFSSFLQFFGEHSEQEFVANTESLKFEEEAHFSAPMLEDTIPLLQMLQSVGSPHFFSFKEPSFQTLLRLQHVKKPWEDYTHLPEMETQTQAIELESCVTHDIMELQYSPVKSETMDLQNPHSASCLPVAGRERRKRKRPRPTKNKEEVESQRMTHIAVERNRRRQMNDHLNVLKSLMPASYIQRVIMTFNL